MASALTNPFDEEDESLAGSSFFAAQGTSTPQQQPDYATTAIGGPAVQQPAYDFGSYVGTSVPDEARAQAGATTTQFDASGGGQAAGGGDYWGADASGGSQYADYANQQPAYDWGSYGGTSGIKEPSYAPTDTSGGFATADGAIAPKTPEEDAIAKDQMARQLYTDLKAAGHDVKWEGDQLMVDGRAYVMGSGAAGAQTLQAQSTVGPQATQTAAGPAALAGTQMTATPTATTTATGATAGGAAAGTTAAPANTRLGGTAGGSFLNKAEGFDINKLNAPGVGDHDTSKYQFLSLAQHIDPRDPNGLQKIVDQAKAAGLNWQFDGKDKIDFGDGYGPIDVLTNATAGQGGDTWWWGAGAGGAEAGMGGGAAGAAAGAGGLPGAGTQGAAGVVTGDMQGAFGNLQAMVGPNASREEMEAAIASAFKGVPGYEEAYKESVKINGQWYDLVGNYGGDNPTWQLMPKNDGAGGAAGVAGAAGGSPLAAGTAGAAGVQLGPGDPGFWIQLPGGGQVPYNHPLAAGQPGAAVPGAAPGGAPAGPPVGIPGVPGSSSVPYQPGTVPDVEGVPGYDQMLSQSGQFTPGQITSNYQFGGFNGLPAGGQYQFGGYGDLGDLGAGEQNEGMTEALYQRIMQNPESLGPREIAMMQGASREEASQMAQLENEQMRASGYAGGIQGSPWMAAEEGRTNRARDEAIIGANRNIDIEAAKTNMGDRRAAAALGTDYLNARSGRNLANRGQRFAEAEAGEGRKLSEAEFKEKQRTGRWTEQVKAEEFRLSAAEAATKAQMSNEDNRFRAEKLKSDNVAAAANHSIQQAAADFDRVKLQETINQEAARLGLAKDELLTQWLTAQMDDLTKRYGIDIQAALAKEGIQVDREKLAQAGSEFQQDLAFRFAALAQEGEMGKLNLGLGYANLGETMAANSDQQYRWMMGGGQG